MENLNDNKSDLVDSRENVESLESLIDYYEKREIVSKRELCDLYMISYIALLQNIISQTVYINILQRIGKKGFKPYHIDNFELLINNLKNNNLIDSMNISILINIRDKKYKTIIELSTIFPEIKKELQSNAKIISKMNKVIRILMEKNMVFKAFKKLDNYQMCCPNIDEMSDIDNIVKNSNKKSQSESWITYNRIEIMQRFDQLTKYLSICQMRKIGLELKSIYEIEQMDHQTIRKFYLQTIFLLEKKIINWIEQCKHYIIVEINYTTCCNELKQGKPTILKPIIGAIL
jgi:hypothetical protein